MCFLHEYMILVQRVGTCRDIYYTMYFGYAKWLPMLLKQWEWLD